MQIDDPVPKTIKDDISAVLRHCGPDTRVDEFLDLGYDLVVIDCRLLSVIGFDYRKSGRDVLHQGAENGRFQNMPFEVVGFGNSDEIRANIYAGYAVNAEQLLGQGRAGRRIGGRKIRGAVLHEYAAREEFQSCRIRRSFSLDKHPIPSQFNLPPLRTQQVPAE